MNTAFFLLKASQPCKDWVEIGVDNKPTKRACGYNPEETKYEGRDIKINFRSDGRHQEMGFWINFASKLWLFKCGIHRSISNKLYNVCTADTISTSVLTFARLVTTSKAA